MMERGFRDCRECHGEGVVRRHAWQDIDFAALPIDADGADISVRTEVVPCPDCEERRAAMKRAEGRYMPDFKSARDAAHWLNANLVEGMRINIPEHQWRSWERGGIFAGLVGYPSARDEMMSNLVGSGWGGWKIEFDLNHRHVMVSRHPTGDKRTYADPDRRHLYKEINGELVHRDDIYAAQAVTNFARAVLCDDSPSTPQIAKDNDA